MEKQLAEVRKDGHDTKTALDKLQQAEEAVDQTLKHLGSAHIKLIETERKIEVLRSQLLDKDNDLRVKQKIAKTENIHVSHSYKLNYDKVSLLLEI